MTVLSAAEGNAFLARYGLPLVEQRVAHSAEEAVDFATELGFPVALKLLARGVSHKSDVGGVRLNISGPGEAHKVAEELLVIGRKAADDSARVLVQPMISGVAELIVGIARDPTFGPVVAVGLGGILTELLGDIALGIPPLSRAEAADLLNQLRGAALLDGYRGRPSADREAILDLIVCVSEIAAEGQIAELDLNPVIVGARGEGCIVVDNRVVLEQVDPASPPG